MVDSITGITALLPEPTYRHLKTLGACATMTFALPDLPGPSRPPDRYSEPRTLSQWAAAFDVTRNTMGSWLRTGQVQARKVGRLWEIAERDMPRETN